VLPDITEDFSISNGHLPSQIGFKRLEQKENHLNKMTSTNFG